MQLVENVNHRASPEGRPQPLAFHKGQLWVGCWDTSRLYAIDTKTWTVLDEVAAPGKPYGMASYDGGIRVVVSLGEEDDRYIYQFVPGTGFDLGSKTACPELTGSHVTSDGSELYLLQMSNQRILALDAKGVVQREIALPTHCAGIGVDSGVFYMISADEEFEELRLATLDVRTSNPGIVVVAEMPPEARALAFDGATWWTSYRESNEIASFAIPSLAALK